MKDDSQVSTSRLEDGAVHWDGDTEGDTDGEGGGNSVRGSLRHCHACGPSGGDVQMRAGNVNLELEGNPGGRL